MCLRDFVVASVMGPIWRPTAAVNDCESAAPSRGMCVMDGLGTDEASKSPRNPVNHIPLAPCPCRRPSALEKTWASLFFRVLPIKNTADTQHAPITISKHSKKTFRASFLYTQIEVAFFVLVFFSFFCCAHTGPRLKAS